jgi:hypothetical protein
VDLWFNGHDHIQSLIANPGAPNTTFVTVGNSGKQSSGDYKAGTSYVTWVNNTVRGFAMVTLYATTVRVLGCSSERRSHATFGGVGHSARSVHVPAW